MFFGCCILKSGKEREEVEEKLKRITGKLIREHSLEEEEYRYLIDHREDARDPLAREARRVTEQIYGDEIFVRGLIEFTNICRNDCLYCGIRNSNENVERYRLTEKQILDCCAEGYELGYRTFVLQGGEDGYFSDEVLVPLIRKIRREYPECAITLSIGERERASYQALFDAGADRYLLRHETADEGHYRKLHPERMSFRHRMNCLQELREIGYAVGAGFMVGSPFQTSRELAEDLKFIETFRPEMCGIGPFIPHRDTPFRDEPAGTLELTCFLLSVIRLAWPSVLLPATTALGTIDPRGREKGVLSGANVVMPNLSPTEVRRNYELYNDKICMGDESAQCRSCLDMRMRTVGRRVVTDRGDLRRTPREEVNEEESRKKNGTE